MNRGMEVRRPPQQLLSKAQDPATAPAATTDARTLGELTRNLSSGSCTLLSMGTCLSAFPAKTNDLTLTSTF